MIAYVVAEVMMQGFVARLLVDDEMESLFYVNVDVAYEEEDDDMAYVVDENQDQMIDEHVQDVGQEEDVVEWHGDEMMNQLHSNAVNDVD